MDWSLRKALPPTSESMRPRCDRPPPTSSGPSAPVAPCRSSLPCRTSRRPSLLVRHHREIKCIRSERSSGLSVRRLVVSFSLPSCPVFHPRPLGEKMCMGETAERQIMQFESIADKASWRLSRKLCCLGCVDTHTV